MPITPTTCCLMGFIAALSALMAIYAMHKIVERTVSALKARSIRLNREDAACEARAL
ncbi:MAG: hypothetical protein AAFX08_05250 [Pseudomonadota bacterium]